ncbi:MAG: histidine kinase [Clostridia bacterium]|nr:histidine kinase [Clostridia bacterium]
MNIFASARIKLIAILVASSLVFYVFIIQLSKLYLTDFFRQTQNEALDGIAEQVMHSVKGTINQINTLMLDVEKRILQNPDSESVKNITEILGRNRSEYIRGIAFIKKNGVVSGYPEIYWEHFAQKELSIISDYLGSKAEGILWSHFFYSNISDKSGYKPSSAIVKQIITSNGEKIGIIAMVVDVESLLDKSSVYGGNYKINTLIYDSKGRLAETFVSYMHGKEVKGVHEEELQNYDKAIDFLKKQMVFYSVSAMNFYPEWKIITIGDVNKLESRFKPLENGLFIVLLYGIFGLICISFIVSWWFTKPLLELSRGIKSIGEGNLDYRIEIKRQDEFGRVASEFNRMAHLTKQMIEEIDIMHERKRQAELNVLISQLNPHFLYNTLNCIDVMVDISPKEDVHKVMRVLTELLKYGLDKNRFLTTLKEEFEYIKKYLYIQSVRYQDRFEFNVEDLLGEIGEIKVLKLIFQPIVENAIFHGLHPLKVRKGKLGICARRIDDILYITVKDNGIGMSQEMVNNLFKNESTNSKLDTTGIGIKNVHDRIRLYYGEKYGIKVESCQNEGTEVVLKMPVNL